MKKVIFIMLVSLLSAGMNLSYAQENTPKTRQQVIEELKQARANGELEKYNSELYIFGNESFKSTKTRIQVIEELKQARANGELEKYNSELYIFGNESFKSTKNRPQVIEELKEYQKKQPQPVLNNY